jgi:hypothetical protein
VARGLLCPAPVTAHSAPVSHSPLELPMKRIVTVLVLAASFAASAGETQAPAAKPAPAAATEMKATETQMTETHATETKAEAAPAKKKAAKKTETHAMPETKAETKAEVKPEAAPAAK